MGKKGGKQPGAGRPLKENKKVPLSTLIEPETRKEMERLRDDTGLSLGELVDKAYKPNKPTAQ
jgi:uncharacterized protein (UPF0303 family)